MENKNKQYSISLKKAFSFFLLAIFVVAIIFFWVSKFNNQKAEKNFGQKVQSINSAIIETNIPQQFKIFYTDEGFNPNSIQIPIGSELEFINNSRILMRVASDPHPTHTDFPEFDSINNVTAQGKYKFTFTKLGSFGYHNHVKSLHRGLIQVVDQKNPIPNIDKTKPSQTEKRDKFLTLLKPQNPDSVFKAIDAIEANNALARDCHDLAHDLGHKAYELYGFSGAMTFNNPKKNSHPSADDICAGGFMHGILEELFLNQPELKNNPSGVCLNIPSINRESCFHGLGHGLMFANERNVKLSLEGCKKILNTIYAKRCFEGVWMEMFWGNTNHAGADSLGWQLEKPLLPCLEAEDDAKSDCFLYAHLGFLRNHPKDFKGAVRLCTKNNLSIWEERYCLRGVGITMMKHFTSHNLVKTESLVVSLSEPEKTSYYEGVIGYSRLSGVKDFDIQNFCNLLKADSEICTKVFNTYYK